MESSVDFPVGAPAEEPSETPPGEALSFSEPPTPSPFDVLDGTEAQEVDAPATPSPFDDLDTVDAPEAQTSNLFEAAPAPVEMPTAPTSIFGGSLPAAATAPAPVDDTDGWISHHDDVGVQPAAPIEDMIGLDSSSELKAAETDPQWELSEPLEGSIFDDVAPTPANDPVVLATEVEQTLNDMDALDGFSLDAGTSSTDFLQPAGIDVPAEVALADEETYASDEELPIPDFTGVYDEEEGDSKSGVESRIDGVGARRAELDKLRPAEETVEEAVEALEKKRSRNLPIRTQIALVVAFALAVLVLVWLFEPAAVADIRSSIESFLP